MAMQRAAINLFTTQGAARRYRERYPEARDRIEILENGFDEECFACLERHPQAREPLHPGSVTMLHSGIVYSSERDPTQLFEALAQLKASNTLRAGGFNLRFRASENPELLQRLTRMHGLEPFIEICPPIGYQAALQEMQRADALLVLQGSSCNEQVPAKVYEYLRAKRPIICLSSEGSDTEGVLRKAGVTAFAPLDSVSQIVEILPRFLASVFDSSATLPDPARLNSASRKERSMVLAGMMNTICSTLGAASPADRPLP
jgi:glycosyltransferase involved in cell wall biosynthesis